VAVVVGEAGDVADAGPVEEVAAEAALERRAGGGGDAEGGEVERAREGEEGVLFGVVWSGPSAAAERGTVERQGLRRWGLPGLRGGGAAEGSEVEVEAEEEAAGGGEAEAREEAARVEMLERRRHGTG
jgi:hypothetical protein